MIDIHTHVLYDVDDGPRTIEDSLELLNYLYQNGVRKVIATPHFQRGRFEPQLR